MNSGTTVLEDEDEEEQDSWRYMHFPGHVSDQEVEKALERKYSHVYSTFVEPVLETGEEFSVQELMNEIRPPYSEDEIQGALQYGVENKGLEYVSSDSVKKI